MPSSKSQRVHEPFVFAALVFALTPGFGLVAVIVAAFAFQWNFGAWWIASVQAHGHAQLFGWAGLARAELAPWALACFVAGFTLHALSQLLLAILAAQNAVESLWGLLGRSALALSGIVELIGAALVGMMLVSSFRRARPLAPDAPILPVRLYLATALASFALATILNAALAIDTALRGSCLYLAVWNDALTHLMIMGFIIPIALALSIRKLPLFVRLAFPPSRRLTPILASYVAGLVLRLTEQLFGIQVGGLGDMLEGGALLAFSRDQRRVSIGCRHCPLQPGY
ncbi:MAG: hypothetical protein HY782_16865, partial [Chloroflexi bacterium]|nr:hypothetical protein [Chloroflexota bacterium]